MAELFQARDGTQKSSKPKASVSQVENKQQDTTNHTMMPPGCSDYKSSNVWYCPSRWLMAHHDLKTNIYTFSSHMCLADLNNDGENLLALIDFKHKTNTTSYDTTNDQQQSQQHFFVHPSSSQAPYECRLRVYRGQQLIYNHFLDDMPSCLIATSVRCSSHLGGGVVVENINNSIPTKQQQLIGGVATTNRHSLAIDKPLLTLTINDDVYFYHKLKPSHKLSLEDQDYIMETLSKSEYEAWQMVRENKVNVETLRELLISLNDEFGCNELTSHSNNFLSLLTEEERKNYLLLWKFKRLNNGVGEHLMSMDTICCASARLKFTSEVTRSGDFGQTRETGTFLNNSKWNKILDIQKDGLVLGTEDRHVLIYELKSTKAHLEANYRLPSTPDHILVERKSPSNFDFKSDLKSLTYKILVSCRNCHIYSIDQSYLIEKSTNATNKVVNNKKNMFKELICLKCNVLDMSWTGDESTLTNGISQPDFVVACLNRRVYCFSSFSGSCKWVVETESPITCLTSLPTSRTMGTNDSCLIGVASQANRIDFYVSLTGRIVDSIYFRNDYCQAMTFGRFGREDNCLCMTTNLGHLLIFILKRTAKFTNAQCLSSAAAFASAIMSNYSENFRQQQRHSNNELEQQQQQHESNSGGLSDAKKKQDIGFKLNQAPGLPTAFDLTKSSIANQADQTIDPLQVDHQCDQVIPKKVLDSYLASPQLQVPVKSRDFVDHVVEQTRHSTGKFIYAIQRATFSIVHSYNLEVSKKSTCLSSRVLKIQFIWR